MTKGQKLRRASKILTHFTEMPFRPVCPKCECLLTPETVDPHLENFHGESDYYK